MQEFDDVDRPTQPNAGPDGDVGHNMEPFTHYPGGGRQLLGPPHDGDNTRRGCGLNMMAETKQRRCAYCGVDLTHDYHTWLLLTVDHVVPTGMGQRLQIPQNWLDDQANKVLACSGCNGFCNRFDDPAEVPLPEWTEEAFLNLRDRVFRKRSCLVAQRRVDEMRFFDQDIRHRQFEES